MKQIYYHYTTRDGAENIIKDMQIRKSVRRGRRGDDVAFGEGVYLTQKQPSSGKHVIAFNNYDGRNQQVVLAMIRKGELTNN